MVVGSIFASSLHLTTLANASLSPFFFKMLEAQLLEHGDLGTLTELLDGMWDMSSLSETYILLIVTPSRQRTRNWCKFWVQQGRYYAPGNGHFVCHARPRSSFGKYRCDHLILLRVDLTNFINVLKFTKYDDICTPKIADKADMINFVYEAKSKPHRVLSHPAWHVSPSALLKLLSQTQIR